jgi:nucleoside-diphosphate-sugar epimerase
MKVLVTGGAGYIGSALVPRLLDEGHSITVLDRFFFGQGPLRRLAKSRDVRMVRDDIRWFDGRLLRGQDAVVDMAALSNDPAGELDPAKTMEINCVGRVRVARLAREAGVRRYVLVSSCSVYGSGPGLMTEDSPTNPLTTYAKANLRAESENLSLSTGGFIVSAVRLATAYGLSGRMRFDLVVNAMVLAARLRGEILVQGGSQWRPLVEVRDASRGIQAVLSCDPADVDRSIFNVGSDAQNYRIDALAQTVASSLSEKPAIRSVGSDDRRSYRVSFAKARSVLGFKARHSLPVSVMELEEALASGRTAYSLQSMTSDWYRHLLSDPKAGMAVALRGRVL